MYHFLCHKKGGGGRRGRGGGRKRVGRETKNKRENKNCATEELTSFSSRLASAFFLSLSLSQRLSRSLAPSRSPRLLPFPLRRASLPPQSPSAERRKLSNEHKMEQTSPEQLALASATKRRCSSNTIDVCAEGARSSASSEVSFFVFDGVGRPQSFVSAWRSIGRASGGSAGGGAKGTSICFASRRNPSTSWHRHFRQSVLHRCTLLSTPRSQRTSPFSRLMQRRERFLSIEDVEGGLEGKSEEGHAACRSSPHQQLREGRAKGQKKSKKKKERPNLVFPPSSFFFCGCRRPFDGFIAGKARFASLLFPSPTAASRA